LLPSGKFSKLALVVAGLLAASLLFAVGGILPPARTLLVSDLLQAAVALWAAYCCFHVARHSSGYLRQLWMLLTITLSLAAIAQGLEIHSRYIAHLPAATPWPSDILFIFSVTPAFMMLLPRPAEDSAGIDWQQVLDFAQVGVIALSAYLYFFYAPSRWQIEGPYMVPKIMRLQLFRDIALSAGFLIRAVTASGHPIRSLFGRMSGLFLLSIVADAVYFVGPQPLPGHASWYDSAWAAPYVFATVFAATWKHTEEPLTQEADSRSRRLWTSRILPVCLPLLVLFMSRSIAVEQLSIAWAAITGSFGLSAARLLLTNEKQRRIAEDLRQTEDALRQTAEMFSTAFRSSPDAMSIRLLPEGRFIAVNETFSRLTGYTQDEIVGGSPPTDSNLWVDLSHRSAILARLQAGEEIREEEFLYRTKNGEIRTGQLSAARIHLGRKFGILGMVRDVTTRKQAEEALRASEARFRNLIQDLHVGIILIDADTEARFINRAALQTFGLSEEQGLGKKLSDIGSTPVREDGTELPLSMLPGPRAIQSAKAIHNEVVGWRRLGSNEVVWTLMDAIPQISDQGQVASVLLSVTNITERKRAEEALQASEERFRNLIQDLHVGVVLLGPAAEIRFANQAALASFGLTEDQTVGKNSGQLGLVGIREDGTEIPFSMRPGPRAIETKQPVRNEVMGWRLAKSNEVLWTLADAVPHLTEAGEVTSVIVAMSDITERKRVEEALHHLSTRLLQLQDEERRRLARELHDSLAQSVMAVNLDLAQVARTSGPLGEQAKHALSEARDVLQQMSREIRTLSYLLHPPALDELGLVSALREYAKGFSERSEVQLEVDFQPDFGRLSQEAETALYRIVQESLTNIQRHSGSQTARIRLRADSTSVQLEVSDRGCGMDLATLRPGNTAGTSLGVGILGMRERMLQLGGKLEVESSSSGTTVRATIPRKV